CSASLRPQPSQHDCSCSAAVASSCRQASTSLQPSLRRSASESRPALSRQAQTADSSPASSSRPRAQERPSGTGGNTLGAGSLIRRRQRAPGRGAWPWLVPRRTTRALRSSISPRDRQLASGLDPVEDGLPLVAPTRTDPNATTSEPDDGTQRPVRPGGECPAAAQRAPRPGLFQPKPSSFLRSTAVGSGSWVSLITGR
ncbi:MAG: hypothetical protein RL685_6505, partial [Pseudomonadota bacterium]